MGEAMRDEAVLDRDAFISHFADFVAASPTSYHAAAAAAEVLTRAGFVELDESEAWPAASAAPAAFVRRDGAIIAWRAGAGVSATSPVRVLGAHTDSPGFVLKPQPDFTAHGWAQLGVEVYGGPLINSWLDRDLGVAGRVVTRTGEEKLVCTGAVARIPQLAIHLDREANNGLNLDRQRNTQPIIGIAGADVSLAELLAHEGITADDIAGFDLRLFDTQRPERIGARSEFFASPRLDNLSSTYAGLAALIVAEPAEGGISMLAAFDHEELGSETRSGASGPFLADVLDRIWAGLGGGVEDRQRALAGSWCLSADAGHSVHPNYGEKHDPNVRPLAGRGPMLKINANQRYASDAHGGALWRSLCAAAGVPTQDFVSNNTVPCGSTIGPLTATRIGMRTVDVGVPLLSMHSARELAHVDDLHGLALVIAEFFA
ncbi:M18 family aminopeptidase [Leucobacter sp. cx-328]|uniref:M18 family aminopeptidase n=2 Tax=unclassified Leucobacter TaxID=2621730 RepID=UPI00351BEF44